MLNPCSIPFIFSFMACLRKSDNDNSKCRDLSKAYLQCRMENDLMLKEDWKSLGFDDGAKNFDSKEPKGSHTAEGSS